MSVGLCSPTKFISLMCIGCLSHQHVKIKKQPVQTQPLTPRTHRGHWKDKLAFFVCFLNLFTQLLIHELSIFSTSVHECKDYFP